MLALAGDLPVEQMVLLYGVLLISLVFHEASHALFAYLGGDRTAYSGGQVTLNPIPHIQREPFGTVILPIAVLLMSKGTMILGYAHIPVDPIWAARNPKRAALMSAAGPLANFALFGLALLGLHVLVWTHLADNWPAGSGLLGPFVDPIGNSNTVFAAAKILSAFLTLNLLLGVFNLFPWPPLDGAAVLEGLFPRSLQPLYSWVRMQPFAVLIGMVAVWRAMDYVFPPVARYVLNNWL
ncbi:MAG: site-2 protease family protein [Planctomycetota bacterium]